MTGCLSAKVASVSNVILSSYTCKTLINNKLTKK